MKRTKKRLSRQGASMSRNKLLPEGYGARFWNFCQNLIWAVVWLGCWTIRLVRKLLTREK